MFGSLAIAVAAIAIVAGQVDDWGRDLTTNVAETDAGAADSLLRPLAVRRSLPAAADLVEQSVRDLPGWAVVGRSERGDTVLVHLTRRSRLFRFVDDITVRIEDRGAIRVLRARSASRTGSGDLGQNPRNLRSLFAAIRAARAATHLPDSAGDRESSAFEDSPEPAGSS